MAEHKSDFDSVTSDILAPDSDILASSIEQPEILMPLVDKPEILAPAGDVRAALAAYAAGADAVRKAKRRTTPRQRMLPRPRTALKTRPPRKRP